MMNGIDTKRERLQRYFPALFPLYLPEGQGLVMEPADFLIVSK